MSDKMIEIYKCGMLTLIAIFLLAIYMKIPIPFTYNNLQAKKVGVRDVPQVIVRGGQIDADVSGTVSIDQ